MRGWVAGALLGVGDEVGPSVDPDALHGPSELAGRFPEVVMGRRRRGAEGCVVQVPGHGVVGAAPEKPGRKGGLIERGAAQSGRHGLPQMGQGAVMVLRLDLPTPRRRE